MSQQKISAEIEFPLELDMFPFTQEGLAQTEAAAKRKTEAKERGEEVQEGEPRKHPQDQPLPQVASRPASPRSLTLRGAASSLNSVSSRYPPQFPRRFEEGVRQTERRTLQRDRMTSTRVTRSSAPVAAPAAWVA